MMMKEGSEDLFQGKLSPSYDMVNFSWCLHILEERGLSRFLKCH